MQDTDITKRLAKWAVELKGGDIPDGVRREGVRTFVNWLGCAVGGARHETVDRALDAVTLFTGPARAQVLGRSERLDELHAALVNGISSHVLDYDDTHLKTIIHPAGPVASAILAVAESRAVSGEDFLTALILGVEVECRIGNSVYPDHYDRGWHITGTAGVFGAAAATGKLLGLDERQMTWAFGIAATQSSGFREMFGTMCKSFHPGRAAQNGAMAAFLAKANFDSSERAIEAPRGWANVLSTKQDYTEIVDGLGTNWEAGLNTYKPYACGIVIHPAIDGCQQLKETLGAKVSEIASVELRTHPLVLELTGKRAPRTGLEGKFSVFHAAATALLKGDGSPNAFTDEMVRDPEIVALRDKVKATTDASVHEDAVHIAVTLRSGERVQLHVPHAVGSLERPLSDDAISEKFARQSAPVIGEAATRELIGAGWGLASTADVATIAVASAARS
ncbi:MULTISPECIES: MmgE/PrpD family protein [unclassified Aureimonas]|uniref:MmgE/PrpD family protein n=1 Tax=unclassified Aureimonas TaxID=2615206 RepID=UPI0006FFAB76|nr:MULTISPECIES: MmgE/PrpD family protein [unclassified Aureimonas]KQT61875.1 2-methylcitrate dehydratase [Aureimonas sp. Leaf460]KQT61915.1 2-methylcitrate dehydratase [Aureimonas sp. Leaf427]